MTIRLTRFIGCGALAALAACTNLPAEYGVTPASQSALPATPPPPVVPPESAFPAEVAMPSGPRILLAQESEPTSGAGATAPAAPPYVNSTWRWQSTLFNDGRQVTPDAPDRYTVQFMRDGRVNVRADCNRGSAGYVRGSEGPQITISAAATTKMACPPGSLGGEFLRQLEAVRGWTIDAGNLVLALKFDNGTMRFLAGN